MNQPPSNIHTAPQSQLYPDHQPSLNKPIQLTSVSSSYSDINNVMPGKILNQINKSMLPKIPKFSRQQPNVERQNNVSNPRQLSQIKKGSSQSSLKSSPSKTTSTSISLKSRSNRHTNSSPTKSSTSSASSKSKTDRSRSDDKKRNRKRSPSPPSSSIRPNYDKSPKRNYSDESKSKRTTSSSPPLSSQSTKFKELKKSSKDRNYIRKNRSETISPLPSSQTSKDEIRSLSQPREMKNVETTRMSPRKSEPKEIIDNSAIVINKRKINFFMLCEIVHIFNELISGTTIGSCYFEILIVSDYC